MNRAIAVCALMLMGVAAFAEDGGRGPLPKPCQSVAAACEAAGYHHGGHAEHKGLWKDCVAPILDGKSIPGVTPNADDVKACAAHPPAKRG